MLEPYYLLERVPPALGLDPLIIEHGVDGLKAHFPSGLLELMENGDTIASTPSFLDYVFYLP